MQNKGNLLSFLGLYSQSPLTLCPSLSYSYVTQTVVFFNQESKSPKQVPTSAYPKLKIMNTEKFAPCWFSLPSFNFFPEASFCYSLSRFFWLFFSFCILFRIHRCYSQGLWAYQALCEHIGRRNNLHRLLIKALRVLANLFFLKKLGAEILSPGDYCNYHLELRTVSSGEVQDFFVHLCVSSTQYNTDNMAGVNCSVNEWQCNESIWRRKFVFESQFHL